MLPVARLGRDIGQPDHILANPIVTDEAERWPGSGEIWFAGTKHDGVQVDTIFIDQPELGKALRQVRTSNFIVLGFAFRDIAENFLASLMLSIRRPFRQGDVISVAGFEGVVQTMNTRSTILVTIDGNHVQIPNGRFSNARS